MPCYLMLNKRYTQLTVPYEVLRATLEQWMTFSNNHMITCKHNGYCNQICVTRLKLEPLSYYEFHAQHPQP
jgi:hypothetical protein